MASFFGAVARLLISNRHPPECRLPVQQAQGPAHLEAQFQAQAHMQAQHQIHPTATISTTTTTTGEHHHHQPHHPVSEVISIPAPGATVSVPGVVGPQGPIYVNPREDSLTFFRLMLGIQTSPYLGFTITGPHGTRPAPNIGLYARIVHSEQKAKDSFKVFSIAINACYFLQIVIAAALTALGAARASSGAVTAFGAINTVIAGFLTFLKGSGLPGRFKYYGNEWKKIREFIEQRERDFMRPGHDLDVYEVVETIEKMYNDLKADIELNTPDSYTSVTGSRPRAGGAEPRDFSEYNSHKMGGIDVSKIENLANRLKSLEHEKSENLVKELGDAAKKSIKKRVKHQLEHVEDEFEHLKDHIVNDVVHHGAKKEKEKEVKGQQAAGKGKKVVKPGIKKVVNKPREVNPQQTPQQKPQQKSPQKPAPKKEPEPEQESESESEDEDDSEDEIHDDEKGVETHATGSALDIVQELKEIHKIAASGGRESAEQLILHLASRLDKRDDEPEPSSSSSSSSSTHHRD